MTLKRDWLKEAYEISAGNRSIKVKKEHVLALVQSITELSQKTQKLHSIMHLAYSEACNSRKNRGLPMPPIPESLRPYIKE